MQPPRPLLAKRLAVLSAGAMARATAEHLCDLGAEGGRVRTDGCCLLAVGRSDGDLLYPVRDERRGLVEQVELDLLLLEMLQLARGEDNHGPR